MTTAPVRGVEQQALGGKDEFGGRRNRFPGRAGRHAAGEKPDLSGQLGPEQDLRLMRPANSYSPSPLWRPLTGTPSLPGNSLVAGAASAKCQVPSAKCRCGSAVARITITAEPMEMDQMASFCAFPDNDLIWRREFSGLDNRPSQWSVA